MKRGAILGLFALGAVTGATLAQQGDRLLTHFETGASYVTSGSDFRLGYTAGVVDALSLAAYAQDADRRLRDLDDCMAQWTIGEIMAIVDDHVARTPDAGDQSAALLAHVALSRACPQ